MMAVFFTHVRYCVSWKRNRQPSVVAVKRHMCFGSKIWSCRLSDVSTIHANGNASTIANGTAIAYGNRLERRRALT